MSLIEDLLEQPGHLIRRAHQLAWSAFMEESRDDITPVQYAILLAVADNPGIDATRLSPIVAFDRATIGNVLDRLERKGLLTRSTSPGDKRAKQSFLTARGKQVIRKIQRSVPRIGERILGPLTRAERRTLLSLLKKLVQIDEVSEMARSGPAPEDGGPPGKKR